MLKIAQFAIRLNMVAERGATGANRRLEDLANGHGQAIGTPTGDRPALAPRRDTGPEQRLGSVNITNAGDQTLVQKKRFDGRPAAAQTSGQNR